MYIGMALATQYFEYMPYNYNSDHNYLHRLCHGQHFLKTTSPCLPLHIRTKQKVATITICNLSNNVAM